MSTPGSGNQPPQDPSQGWGQQPPTGQPGSDQQPPAGQQPQTGQQFGAPQGQPQQFGQPGQPQGQPQQFGQPGQPWGAPGGQPQQPAKKSGIAKLLPIIGGVVVLVVVAVLAFSFLGGGDPEVGDCVQQTGAEDVETVDCDSSDAQYKVVGIDEERDDLTYAEFLADSSTCSQFDGITSQLWYGTDGDDAEGTIYCLGDV